MAKTLGKHRATTTNGTLSIYRIFRRFLMSETTAGAGMVVPPPDATLDTPAGVVGAAPAGYASAAPVVGGKCSISDYAHHFIAAIVAIGYVVIIAIGTKPPDVLTGGFVTVIAAYLGGTVTAVGIRRANNGNSN